jgi:hypothetical protein
MRTRRTPAPAVTRRRRVPRCDRAAAVRQGYRNAPLQHVASAKVQLQALVRQLKSPAAAHRMIGSQLPHTAAERLHGSNRTAPQRRQLRQQGKT